MKKSNLGLEPSLQSGTFIVGPAYPKTANEVVRRLKKAIDKAECQVDQELSQKLFGRLIGAPKSTIHDWYHGDLAAPIKHFLCGMERLSEAQRKQLLSELCRDCPRLQHPRLAHDPIVINSLKGLLGHMNGLTFVIGSTEEIRSFLITALGNSAGQLTPAKVLCGLDIHRPELYSPVPGVLHFQNPPGAAIAMHLVEQVWKNILNSSATLFLFNGLWGLIPQLQADIFDLARKRNVIVADGLESKSKDLRGYTSKGLTINVLKTSAEQGGRIRVSVNEVDSNYFGITS